MMFEWTSQDPQTIQSEKLKECRLSHLNNLQMSGQDINIISSLVWDSNVKLGINSILILILLYFKLMDVLSQGLHLKVKGRGEL